MRLAALFCALLVPSTYGQNPVSTSAASSSLEYKVKAAFLLNFSKFVAWPGSDSGSSFNLCVIGEDPFGTVLDRVVQDESINGRKVVLQRSGRDSVKACDVAYIGKSDKSAKEWLSELGPNVLTVGEGDSFLRDGGVIAFVLENRRVRFDISLSAARAEQLTVSSKLLAVARSVVN